jgi:hypothetical protein
VLDPLDAAIGSLLRTLRAADLARASPPLALPALEQGAGGDSIGPDA